MNQFKLFLVLSLFLICIKSNTQTSLFNQQMQIGFEEKQGQYADLSTKLVNESGDTVLLGDVINKPAILNLVYYQCPGTCSPLMWGISKFIDQVDLVPGKDYEVTVSYTHLRA